MCIRDRVYTGAIDVDPRMTKTEMEAAVKAGKFIFKVDRSQNVTVVYDINRDVYKRQCNR